MRGHVSSLQIRQVSTASTRAQPRPWCAFTSPRRSHPPTLPLLMMRECLEACAQSPLTMKVYRLKPHRSSNVVYCAIISNAHTRRENWEPDLPETAVAPLRSLLPLVQRISISKQEPMHPTKLFAP